MFPLHNSDYDNCSPPLRNRISSLGVGSSLVAVRNHPVLMSLRAATKMLHGGSQSILHKVKTFP